MKSEFSFSGFFLTCIVLCGVLILTGLSYTPLGAIAAGGIQAAETTAAAKGKAAIARYMTV